MFSPTIDVSCVFIDDKNIMFTPLNFALDSSKDENVEVEDG
jgi:hypothetical protein